MSKIRTLLLAIAAFAVAALAARAGAQGSAPASGADPMAFLAHAKNARFLAADDLAARNLVDCSMPPGNAAAGGPPLADAPPTRIFDELYYLGTNSAATSGGVPRRHAAVHEITGGQVGGGQQLRIFHVRQERHRVRSSGGG